MPENQKTPHTRALPGQLVWLPFVVSGMLIVSLFGSSAAYAIEYDIEIVLFENTSQSGQYSTPELYHPRTNEAMALESDAATSAGFVALDSELTLIEQAQSLDASGSYKVLEHFAWRQPGLDDENAMSIRVSSGRAFKHYVPPNFREFDTFIPATVTPSPAGDDRQITSTEVNGSIKIRLGRFLHLDANLVFTDIEDAHSYRLSHSRKMRSRELHYIDNPRFGFLVRILPVPE